MRRITLLSAMVLAVAFGAAANSASAQEAPRKVPSVGNYGPEGLDPGFSPGYKGGHQGRERGGNREIAMVLSGFAPTGPFGRPG
jgi:hypothetical protein